MISTVSLPTELLCWVDVLRLVSVDVDQDDLGGAVRQTGVQTGHCNQVNNMYHSLALCFTLINVSIVCVNLSTACTEIRYS